MILLPISTGNLFQLYKVKTILEFYRRVTGEDNIPTLCDDPRLTPYGACRVCSVEVALQADGPVKTMASCHTPISSGMHVLTQSDSVSGIKKKILLNSC